MVDHVTLTHAVGVRLSHPQLLCGDGRTSNLKCVSRTDTDAFGNKRLNSVVCLNKRARMGHANLSRRTDKNC